MYILNITCIIEDHSAAVFLKWLKDDFKVEIEHSIAFEEIKILKVLDSPNEGQTYTLQLFSASKEVFTGFKSTLFLDLSKKMNEEYRGKLLVFDSFMQLL